MKKTLLLIAVALSWQAIAGQNGPDAVGVSCTGCDKIPNGQVTIKCSNGVAQVADFPSAKLTTGLKISWTTTTTSGSPSFTVTFPATGNPCNGVSAFNETNSTCVLTPAPQQQYPTTYTYTVQMNGCASPGTGTIEYLKPSAKLSAKKRKASKASHS